MDTTSYTVWQLAGLADVHSPDSLTSPGAAWLEQVARSLDDSDDWTEDTAHELADDVVPIYTHERFQVFVDICAYQEDVTEFGPIGDMEQAAGVALYMIAVRLIDALHNEADDAE